MSEPIVLSCFQTGPLLHARQEGCRAARASLDLGLTEVEVLIESDRAIFPDDQWLTWDSIQQISQNDSVCFVVEENDAEKIQRFSEPFNRFYSLMPTGQAPTLLVSGIAMHRIKGIDPHRDTLKKIRTIAPITVLEIARLNPWSQQLFQNPRIRQIVGDSFEEIEGFEDESFSRIVHDPPMFSLAGELYSGAFYRHLFRLLKRKGRVFHYIGDLDSRSGRNVARGVVRRLQEAGFSRVVRKPEAFGVIAFK
jgi:predicted methyltransferase